MFKWRDSATSILFSLTINREILKVCFKYTSESDKITNAFQKQILSILKVYFITKFLMDSKYKWKIQIIF